MSFRNRIARGLIPFFARALDGHELEDMQARVQTELESTAYDHNAWFFGSVEQSIPRHTGYSVGFSIVAPYIHSSGTPASRLWDVPAEVFYSSVA